jgi:hypothetical protein
MARALTPAENQVPRQPGPLPDLEDRPLGGPHPMHPAHLHPARNRHQPPQSR